MQVNEISNAEWDSFIEASPNGTLFSSSKFCDIFEPYQIKGVFKGNELIGGMIHTNKSGGLPFRPYQGMILKNSSYEYSVAKVFSELNIPIVNHYTIQDIRPFLWKGFKPFISYTYVVSEKNTDKDTRYEINKALKSGIKIRESNLDTFKKLYNKTVERKEFLGADNSILEKMSLFNMKVYEAVLDNLPIAGTLIISDSKRDYYMFGATLKESLNTGASSLCLSYALSQSKEMDLCGCNVESIGMFKRGFGGILKPCLGAICTIA